ncbi:protein unc-13 homolog [Rhodamnia argentea]|uniref:Protein unc-13 homolog n=1 Tax=Rhodamnia argentea TaxID=178133 RepID=A0A8B8Q5W1_9MYRT|nr:protein unc-13 homolog [Rhodamnia argentea]
MAEHLPSPFGDPAPTLSDPELRETSYEVLVAACRSSGSRPLTYVSQSERSAGAAAAAAAAAPPQAPAAAPSLQRSLTSTAASKVKKALGLKRRESMSQRRGGDSAASQGRAKRPVTVGEMVRVQMKVSEQIDSRVRRALLRVAAGQLGRRMESVVLPLELLQQYKLSDFPNPQEYEAWQRRHLKVLEAGLLLHPHLPLSKTDTTPQRLRKLIRAALENPRENERNGEAAQLLRSNVMSLACRSFDGSASETCHWADGFPFNLRLYQMLLEACFDVNDETSVIEEVDEVLELIKKTWAILGMNQALHNLCFAWVLFQRYVATGQAENDLLFAAGNLLMEVENDAKHMKDENYSMVLSSTLNSILNWAEKRLLAYHDTFHSGNIDVMQSFVSLCVSSARILAEGTSHEHRMKKNDTDVASDRVEAYIRSSLRMVYSQKKEKMRKICKSQHNALPFLSILAQDIRELVVNEKELFSPILKRWHPLAAGVAVATLHSCYGNELNRFVSGIEELTPEAMQVLIAADKLEKDLVQVAVEDSVDSEDGGKSIIQEMPPYEAESVITNLVMSWIKTRVDRLREWVDRNLQQEVWSPNANKERFAPSAVEVLRIVDETLEAFFLLPIPVYQSLLPQLISGLDRCLQQYIVKAKAGCGTKSNFVPAMPALTRCTTGSKYNRVSKKKEKEKIAQRRKSQIGITNGDDFFGVPQLCVRINTLQHFRTQLEVLSKKTLMYLRSSDPTHADAIADAKGIRFELAATACVEGIQQLCEMTAYKVIFQNLSPVLWDALYVGDVASSRIEPFLQDLEQYLETLSSLVHDRVRTRVITDVMRASFEGFLLVLLAGGPCRAFSLEDSQIVDEDFKLLEELFWSNGDGLPADLIDKFSATVKNILPLFHANTESLIERFKQISQESNGSSTKSKPPLPPTPSQWSPNEPNTILRVLCYRNDQSATKFLKKTYNFPKKL